MKELQVGIFGLGTVGSGTVDILTNNKEIIQTSTTTPVRVKTVCVKDTSKQRKVNLHGSKLTSDPNDILDDPEIDIVVEVMGGIEYSKSVIEQAFKKGKHVVSANKDLIALYGKELTDMARKHNCHFFFEAAVAGGIPILRALQFSLIGNQVQKIGGIINGSTNYILTRMQVEELSLDKIIDDAKRLGYLETDPSADLEGYDAARKCAILASIAFNNLVTFDQVYVSGINNITLEDIKYAKNLGYTIKLLAIAENTESGIVARVHPCLIPSSHPLAGVMYSFNAVYVICDKLGETMFYGKGAGDLPTGSAVVNDIASIAKNISFNQKPEYGYKILNESRVLSIDEQSFSYYLRLNVQKNLINISDVLNIFDKYKITIKTLDKFEKKQNGNSSLDYIITTGTSLEESFNKAVKEIEDLSSVNGKARIIRIERGL